MIWIIIVGIMILAATFYIGYRVAKGSTLDSKAVLSLVFSCVCWLVMVYMEFFL